MGDVDKDLKVEYTESPSHQGMGQRHQGWAAPC